MSNNDNFDYEDMVDGEEVVQPVNQGTDVQQQVVQQQEIEPVKLSKGKALALVLISIGVLIFILKIISGVALVRKSENVSQNQEVQNVVQQNQTPAIQNTGDKATQNSDNSVVSTDVGSTSPGNITDGNNTEVQGDGKEGLVKGEIVEQKEQQYTEEEKAEFEMMSIEPVLGAEVQVSGIVKGISMYRVGNSYTYGINLILVIGNDTNVECTYFCPKKTADALSIGNSLQVKYQADSVGNICVVSISK